jgi:hypothetical protein
VDFAPRVLLDELVHAGVAEVDEGIVRLKTEGYVPKRGEPASLDILAEDPPELVETILRNVFADPGAPSLFQRKVFYDNLARSASEGIRKEVRREGEKFIRKVNRILARHDRDRNPKAEKGEPYYAAVGVYLFESEKKPPAGRRPGGASKGKERGR